MATLMDIVRRLKVVAVVALVVSTVWVMGWERSLTQRVERGYYLPPSSRRCAGADDIRFRGDPGYQGRLPLPDVADDTIEPVSGE